MSARTPRAPRADARAAADERTRAALLEVARDHSLGWVNRGRAGFTYKWWTSETEYRTLTPAERRALHALIESGEVRLRAGWQHHRGLVLVRGDNWL